MNNKLPIKVKILPILEDNYVFLGVEEKTLKTFVVDPGESYCVIEDIEKNGLVLEQIWLTHHHGDHIDGARGLIDRYNPQVIVSKKDASRIKLGTKEVNGEEEFRFTGNTVQVLSLNGHTLGGVGYYVKNANAVFVGDCLFNLGCGRLFEGSAEQMHESLKKISQLPEETLVYCAHEYTKKNLDFVRELDPQNKDLVDYEKEINIKLNSGEPTIPTTVEFQKKCNPFLRLHDKVIRSKLGMTGSSDLEVFTKLRELRNSF